MILYNRNRILRQSAAIRAMVAETTLTPSSLIAPLFIIEGQQKKESIVRMPNYYRMTIDKTIEEVKKLFSLGIRAVLLFVKCPDHLKDNEGTEALNDNGLMQRSIKAIKSAVPDICIMTDVALDPFSIYGHDGIVKDNRILNDATVDVLAKMSLSHAKAGADFVAPSDMMDGRVVAIRKILETHEYHQVGIVSYSAKYASVCYGPFRDALDSSPGFGDKQSYQMNIANRIEAIEESVKDVAEGANIIMIKPAGWYTDIIREVREHVHIPIAAYQVSGEYSMIKLMQEKGWIDEKKAIIESLTSIKRAGASMIVTYFASAIATWWDS